MQVKGPTHCTMALNFFFWPTQLLRQSGTKEQVLILTFKNESPDLLFTHRNSLLHSCQLPGNGGILPKCAQFQTGRDKGNAENLVNCSGRQGAILAAGDGRSHELVTAMYMMLHVMVYHGMTYYGRSYTL